MGKIIKQPHGGAIFQAAKGETKNPNGRPRKLVSHFLKEFKAMGLEPVTSEQIKGMIENLLNLKKDELDKVATNELAPVGIRLIARHLIKAGDKEQIAEWLLSRAHGRVNQHIELTGENGGAILIKNVGVDIDKV